MLAKILDTLGGNNIRLIFWLTYFACSLQQRRQQRRRRRRRERRRRFRRFRRLRR